MYRLFFCQELLFYFDKMNEDRLNDAVKAYLSPERTN